MCSPTDYAVSQGVWTDASKKTDGRAACRWWLRSPGNYSDSASYVDAGGLADYRGYYVFDDYNAVRPAMWIQISD